MTLRLQLGDLIEQTGKFAVLRPGDFSAIIQIGTRRSAGQQRDDQRDGQKKNRRTRIPPPSETRIKADYSRDSSERRCFFYIAATSADSFSRKNEQDRKKGKDRRKTPKNLHTQPRASAAIAQTGGDGRVCGESPDTPFSGR